MRRLTKLLPVILALWGGTLRSQVVLTSIPEPVDGVVEVCLGSTVLFLNETDESQLNLNTEYTWSLPDTLIQGTWSDNVPFTFDSAGTFEVSLAIVTLDGNVSLGLETLVVQVSEQGPPTLPVLEPANECTVVDTTTGTTIFQTQGFTGTSCQCILPQMGPAIQFVNADDYPDNTTSRIYWGGPGDASNGGTADYTEQMLPAVQETLFSFPGQINELGHYSNQGAYQLMHVVQFDNGCIYSAHYVMSWGAAEIDFCSNNSLTVCYPDPFTVCFDTQAPGTEYYLSWGDGSDTTLHYPNLPTYPNELGHLFAPSCSADEIDSLEAPYEIQITAVNRCSSEVTVNEPGTISVQASPDPLFSYSTEDLLLCQEDSIVFTQEIVAGLFSGLDSICREDFRFVWEINGTSLPSGDGYELIQGELGSGILSILNYQQGTDNVEFFFNEPGTYVVGLKAMNGDYSCQVQEATKVVSVSPIPYITHDDVSVCSGEVLELEPLPGSTIPAGTVYTWTVPESLQLEGESPGFEANQFTDVLVNNSSSAVSVVYEITPIAPGPCPGQPFNVPVTVYPGIVVPDLALAVCNGAAFDLDLQDSPPDVILPDGVTYTWDFQDSPLVLNEETGVNAQDFTQQLDLAEGVFLDSVLYQVDVVAGEGCEGASFEVNLVIHEVDAGSIAGDQTLCQGESPSLISFADVPTAGGAVDIQWQSKTEPSSLWVNIDGENGLSYLPPGDLMVSTKYRARVRSALLGSSCLMWTNEVEVEVRDVPEPLISGNQVVCEGDLMGQPLVLESGQFQGEQTTFQWEQLIDGEWTSIQGAEAASYLSDSGIFQNVEFRLVVGVVESTGTCYNQSASVEVDVNFVEAGVIQGPLVLCTGDESATWDLQGTSSVGELSWSWELMEGGDAVQVAEAETFNLSQPLNADATLAVTVQSVLNGVVCGSAANILPVELNEVFPPSLESLEVVCEGQLPQVIVPTVNGLGDGVIDFQWEVAESMGDAWAEVPGETGLTIQPTVVTGSEVFYRQVITSTVLGVECQATSDPMEILVNLLEGGVAQPELGEICVGGDISVVAEEYQGPPSPDHVWFVGETEEGPWQELEGAVDQNLSYTPSGSGVLWFLVESTGTLLGQACSVVSLPGAVSVVGDPSISAQPLSLDSLCVGGSLSSPLSVSYSGGVGSPSYQWSDGSGLILDATSPTFLPSDYALPGTYTYSVSVSLDGEGCDNVVSLPSTVEVLADPLVGPLVSAEYCEGSPVVSALSFSLEGGVGSPSYQWYDDAGAISGATSSSFTPPVDEVGTTDYTCVVTQSGANCSSETAGASIEVLAAPQFVEEPEDQALCLGGEALSFAVDYEQGTGSPSYQWYSSGTSSGSGVPVAEATSDTFTPPVSAAGETWYYCVVTLEGGGCSSIQSSSGAVSVVGDPTISAQPLSLDSLCVGGSLSSPLSVSYSGGVGSPSYQWSDGSGLILDATSPTFLPSDYALPGTYTYSVSVSLDGEGCDNVVSLPSTVEVLADPLVGPLVSAEYCEGSPVVSALSFSLEGGVGSPSYQWYDDAGAISGATSSSFTPPVDEVGTTDYTCVVTQSGANCSSETAGASIEVLAAPQFVEEPEDQALCLGGEALSFAVDYEQGTGSPSYQWYSSGTSSGSGVPVAEATSDTFTPPVSAAGETWYYCVVTLEGGGCSSIQSSSGAVSVVGDPTISAQPLSLDSLCVGGSLSSPLSVSYSGGVGSPSYQWSDGSGLILDATSPTFLPSDYALPGTYTYSVSVSLDGEGCDNVVSLPSTVEVLADPLVGPLVSAEYCEGSPVVSALSFSLEGGVGSPSYQWYDDAGAISGATSSSFTPPVDEVGTTDYTCVVTQSGANCSSETAGASIEVLAAPQFVEEPEDQALCLGGEALSFAVDYEQGTGSPSYQWYSSGTSSGSGVPVAEATSDTFTPPVSAAGETWYYCVVTLEGGGCSSIQSSSGAVSVVGDPTISAQPLSLDSLCVGGSLSSPLSVSYSGGVGSPSYQWSDGSGLILDATSPTFLPSDYALPGTYTYSVSVSLDGEGCDNVVSLPSTVEVLADPLVGPLVSAEYCEGSPVVSALSFSLEGGVGSPSYQWYDDAGAISGATSSSFTPPVDEVGTTDYTCVVTQSGANCSSETAGASIEVLAAPQFVEEPEDQALCLGGEALSFAVDYEQGTGSPSYQWYSSGTSSGSGVPVAEATSDTFTPPVSAAGETWYYCVVTLEGGGCSSIQSSSGAVSVVGDPTISAQPLSLDSLCVGGSLSSPLSVSYSGGVGSPSYQWSDGSGLILDATSPTFLPSDYALPGTYTYSVSVSLDGEGCDNVVSLPSTVEVLADPLVGPLVSAEYCEGSPVVSALSFSLEGGVGSPSYQWYDDAGAISGATSSSFTPPVDEVGTTDYTCVVTQSGANCSSETAGASIEVLAAPQFSSQPASQTLCQGAVPDLLSATYASGVGSPSFQWHSSATGSWTDAIPLQAESAQEFLPSTALSGLVHYGLSVEFDEGGCAQILSEFAPIYINGLDAGVLSDDQEICAESAPSLVEFDLQAAGEGVLSYQWEYAFGEGGTWSVDPGQTSEVWQGEVLDNTLFVRSVVSSTLNGVVCVDTTASLEVFVHPLPAVLALPDQAICNGEEVQWSLESDIPSVFEWSVVQNSNVVGYEDSLQEGGFIAQTLTNMGSEIEELLYVAAAISDGFGCQGHPTEFSVQVVPDVVMDSPAFLEICSGAPVNALLTSNVEGDFSWSVTLDNPLVTGESIDLNAGSLIDDYLTNESGLDQVVIYSVFPVSDVGGCEGSVQTLAVSVKPPLAVTVPEDLTVCSGDSLGLDLITNTEVVFNWFASFSPQVDGETTEVQNDDLINDVLTVEGEPAEVVYTVVATALNDACSSPLTQVHVQVNPVPELLPASTATFCTGDTVPQLTFNAEVDDVEVSWSIESAVDVGIESFAGQDTVPGWIALNPSTTVQTAVVAATPSYTSGNLTCTGFQESYFVEVLPVPEVLPMSDVVLCDGEVLGGLEPPTSSLGTTFSWEVEGDVGIEGQGTGTLPPFIADNPTDSTIVATATVQANYPNGGGLCAGNTEDFQFVVHPSPSVQALFDVICSGETTNMDLASDLPSLFQWSAIPNPDVQGESLLGQNSTTIGDQLELLGGEATTVDYEVVATSLAHGCPSPTTVFSCLVHPRPVPMFSADADVLCDSTEVVFLNESANGLLFEWTYGEDLSSEDVNLSWTLGSTGDYEVALAALDPATGCEATLQQTFVVNASPEADFSTSASNVCGDEDVFFEATSPLEGGMYLWDFGNGSFSTNDQFSGIQYDSGDCYDVSLSLTSPEGCTSTLSVEDCVCAYEAPVASFSASTYTSDVWDMEVQFDNQSMNATGYAWSFGDDSISYDIHPVHTYPGPGLYEVELVAWNGAWCSDAAVTTVEIKPSFTVYVPNAFSPDRDQLNETWKPVVSDPEMLDTYQLWVFSRWGEELFYTEDPEAVWIGNDQDGNHYVESETYGWRLEIQVPYGVAFTCPQGQGNTVGSTGAQDCVMKGVVTVIR